MRSDLINPVHLRGSTMAAKILDFRLSQSLKNALSRILNSPKVSLERWFLHFRCKNFSEFPPDLTIEVSIIVFLIPQHFSWFKNYKSSRFSNFLLVLLSLVSKQQVIFDTDPLLMMKMVAKSNASNVVNESQYFHIEFAKSVTNLKNLWKLDSYQKTALFASLKAL